MTVLTLSNFLSLLRGPLALLFLPAIPLLRLVVLLLAGLSDIFDGYIARRSGTATPLGAVLDPVMDKLFTFVVVGTFYFEGTILAWQAFAFLARDFFLALFALYLWLTGAWRGYRPRAYLWGKVTTVAQYIIWALIVVSVPIPGFIYALFVLLGLVYLVQLVLLGRTGA